MSFGDRDDRREIIIVKRRRDDDDDGHHGGVWKIAFADFMTAMMCFFLVMWLVNATSEDTKLAVASYFNPMRLVDPTPRQNSGSVPGHGSEQSRESNADPNGNQTDRPSGTRNAMSGPADNPASSDVSDTHLTSDRHLFADPYAVLAEIALQTATLQNISDKGDGGAQLSGPATGAHGGESYRDPFAPDFWSQAVAAPAQSEESAPEDLAQPAIEDEEAAPAEITQDPAPPIEPALATTEAVAVEEKTDIVPPAPSQNLEGISQELRTELAEAFGADDALNGSISVEPMERGVLISITDDLNYGMFEIGSAVPVGELVRAMETVGAALETRTGNVSIMGHTDGRPFRSAEYDNWRLSTARAHAAYYMLVRGGLEEMRIGEVAGFADRRLKNPADPFDGENRRIEIFLEVAG